MSETVGEKPKGPPPEQLQATLDWVSRVFSDYYASLPGVWTPSRLLRREFGFMWNAQKAFHRHIQMSSAESLHRYLVEMAPHHAYYSTAYYDKPFELKMVDKEWRGADLIFDLDADHLSTEAKEWPFEKQLAVIKKEARKLLDEFILGDLGVAQEHVRCVFSGGRGFHFHVSDPRVWEMDGAARREIVDYLAGKTLSPEVFVQQVGVEARMPPPSAPAWEGRYARGVLAVLDEVMREETAEGVAAAAKRVGLKGVGEKNAALLLAAKVGGDESPWERLKRTGRTAHPALKKLLVQESVGVRGLNDEAGESDEPVTADVKRLIRLPGTLHGKTGLLAQEVALDAFDAFDPLRDGAVLGDELVDVVVSKPERVRLGGVDYKCDAGEQSLSLRYAMFLALRRKALVVWQKKESGRNEA